MSVRNLKRKLLESDVASYLLLFVFYVAINGPGILGVTQFHKLVWPLSALYFSETLLSGLHVNLDLAHTVISPAHQSLIYPPGNYALSAALGSVRNMFCFLFVVQVAVPFLAFNVLRRFAPRVFAFCVSILLTYYCTSVDIWYPDFIIQPLMMGVIFALIAFRDRPLLRSLILGAGTGIIIVLKHNIGVFLLILCGTYIFLDSLKKCDGAERKNGNALLYTILVGGAVFGYLFVLKLPDWFDRLVFLGPYFMFWAYVLTLVVKNYAELDGRKFINDGMVLATSSLVLPLAVFVHFGSVIGFQRYWYSLFGMGFDYIAVWNYGVLRLIRDYVRFDGVGQLVGSCVSILFFLGPFALNGLAIASIYMRRSLNESFEGVQDRLKIMSVGVMGVFLLFPLEDRKIAQTKFVVFMFVFAIMASKVSARSWRYLTALSLLAVIPVTVWAYHKAVKMKADLQGTVMSSDEVGVILLPLEREIDREIGSQVSVLRTATRGEGYFIFTSPKYNLAWLPALAGNAVSQHYFRFDDEIMNEKISNAVIGGLGHVNYVVVATDEYESYSSGDRNGSEFGRVMAHIVENYSAVGQYVRPASESPATKHIDSFIILKKICDECSSS